MDEKKNNTNLNTNTNENNGKTVDYITSVDSSLVVSDKIVSDEIVTSITSNSVDNKKNTDIGTYKFPIGLLVGFGIGALLFLVYFYVFMTPKKAFNGTINDIFNGVFSALHNIKREDGATTLKADFQAKVIIDNKTRRRDQAYAYIYRFNNMQLGITVSADLDNGNYGFTFGSKNVGNFGTRDKVPERLQGYVAEGADIAKSTLYIKDGETYLGETVFNNVKIVDDAIKIENFNTLDLFKKVKYTDLDKYEKVITSIKDDFLSKVASDHLNRSIVLKKISDQSLITLKSNCELDSEDILILFEDILTDILNDHNGMLTDLSELLEVSTDEAKDIIVQTISNLDIKYIYADLYTNLMDTQVFAIDLIINNYYLSLELYNENYDVVLKEFNKVVKLDEIDNAVTILDTEFLYSAKDGIINGVLTLVNEDTGLKAVFDYARDNEKYAKGQFCGSFSTKLYYIEDDGTVLEKPFATLENEVTFTLGEQIKLFDKSYSVKDYYREQIKKTGDDEMVLRSAMNEDLVLVFTEFTHYGGAVQKSVGYNKWRWISNDKSISSDKVFTSKEDAFTILEYVSPIITQLGDGRGIITQNNKNTISSTNDTLNSTSITN